MTTLAAIGYTFAGGSVVSAVSLIAFGFAVRCRHFAIAPRCTARPKDTIYAYKPVHKCQKRGNAWFGWICWSLGLSYETMLRGVPGTGTRKNGLEGSMLKVNLDAIILFRFNALCLRIALVTTLLAIGVILPLNWTADPDNHQITYNRTTFANIPALGQGVPDIHSSDLLYPKGLFDKLKINLSSDLHTQFRLYVIALCSWIITYYICVEIGKEWKENIALRRKYYFEADHYENRKEELNSLRNCSDVCKVKRREPWVMDPEMRDTVPNIELYSVLVGQLPSLPSEVLDEKNLEATIGETKRQKIDWQLAVATSFFDHCVPNQPGFSSSVAAVTVLPDAPEIAKAWRKWYSAAGALRRLRFIRSIIADRRYFDIEDVSVQESNNSVYSSNQNIFIENESQPIELDFQFLKDFHASEEVETQFMRALNFGPEQTGVYSREFAQGAANCCPNGCREGRVRRLGIDDVLAMEKQAILKVQEANKTLRSAQAKAGNVYLHDHVDESLKIEASTRSKQKNDFKIFEANSAVEVDRAVLNTSLSHPSHCSEGEYQESVNGSRRSSVSTLNFNPDGHKFAFNIKSIDEESFQDEEEDEEAFFCKSSKVTNLQNKSNGSIHEKDDDIFLNNEECSHLRRSASAGVWSFPILLKKLQSFKSLSLKCLKDKIFVKKMKKAVTHLHRNNTFAIVTFTNRQAAVAARHCLSDGRGSNRWVASDSIPVPPLADAASCDFVTCRGCCRPVTLSLPKKQQMCRKWCATTILVLMFIGYTFPISFVTSLVNIEQLYGLSPKLEQLVDSYPVLKGHLSGIVSATLYSLFFSVCPVIFKSISNFGSNANTIAEAEFYALRYYWWFMFITAFAGSSLLNAALNAISEGILTANFTNILKQIADTIPVAIAGSWLNWIILRFTVILPFQYLLQFNTFLFLAFGWKCCARSVTGGGLGGHLPYRIYVDAGTVFMCLYDLSFASPIVAPICALYFLICEPILRRNSIYLYRPKYDAGGFRWPFLTEICFSSVFLGHLLLSTMFLLRKAIGPSVVAFLQIIPCYMFRKLSRLRYYSAYYDAGLLQLSLSDMWDINEPTSMEKREEFRRFLTDAHKAAYIPICIAGAGDSENIITAEPAVVVPIETDLLSSDNINTKSNQESFSNLNTKRFKNPNFSSFPLSQHGMSFRRTGGNKWSFRSSQF